MHPARNAHAPSVASTALLDFSKLSHKQHYVRKKIDTKCDLIFPATFVSNISHPKKN
jgi:hypothetical protein